jgi:hypothetical protein
MKHLTVYPQSRESHRNSRGRSYYPRSAPSSIADILDLPRQTRTIAEELCRRSNVSAKSAELDTALLRPSLASPPSVAAPLNPNNLYILEKFGPFTSKFSRGSVVVNTPDPVP